MSDVLCGSHLPILIKVIQNTTGPVLEMGMGYGSTPVLHWLCTAAKRQLVSLENDPKWYKKDLEYQNEYHQILLVEDWDKAPIDNTQWGVVLIDHRPAVRRRVDAMRLKDKAGLILMHDSEPEIDRFYRYSGIYKHFKYRFDYTMCKPNTVVLSNFIDPRQVLL